MMRIDRLLWFLRLVPTRSKAQALVAQGHVRRNGRRVERPAQETGVGDILVVPLPRGVTVIELLAVPARRGPALEAQACYRVLDEPAPMPIAPGNNTAPLGSRIP